MKYLIQKLLLLVLVLATGYAMAENRSLQQIIDSGELRVGMNEFTPWAMRGREGDLIGSEPDIAKRLAADMSLKLKLVALDSKELIHALNIGEIDIIIAGFSVTPSRALLVNFSNSYGKSGIGLASNIAKTKNVKSMADLQDAKVRVGAVSGGSGYELARRLFKQSDLQTFPSIKEANMALVKGDIHALVGPSAELQFLALRNADVIDQPLAKPLIETYEAFAVRKGDYDFVNFLNAWILARSADAWLESTRYYWFNTLRWQDRVAK